MELKKVKKTLNLYSGAEFSARIGLHHIRHFFVNPSFVIMTGKRN